MEEKNKLLFLWLNTDEFHARQVAKRGYRVSKIFKQSNLFPRIIRRIIIELRLPGISYWIPSWKEEIIFFDTVIIHASKLTPPVVKFIRKKNPKIRIVVWYWNPVDKTVDIDRISESNCELWSFDKADCDLYGLMYNTQYYFDNIEIDTRIMKYDVIFVGRDKGRRKGLLEIQKILDGLGISNFFFIAPSSKIIINREKFYSKSLSYTEYLHYISKSKVILDYVSEGQSGLTVRPLEALFLKKKLITNNFSIRNMNFYRSENIFIYGEDKIENLANFIDTPYAEVEEEIVKYYDFDNWILRFFK